MKYNNRLYLNAVKMIVMDSTQLSKIDIVDEASRIPKATPIYKINGYSDNNLIAVKDDSNSLHEEINTDFYSVYLVENFDARSKKLDLSEQKVESIDIYKEGKLFRTLKGAEIKNFIALVKATKEPTHIEINNAKKYSVLYKSHSPIILTYNILQKDNQYILANNDLSLPITISSYLK